MHVLTPGYRYVAQHFENPDLGTTIQFIEKERRFDVTGETPTPDALQTLVTVNDGTTNEELIKILIDRLKHLWTKLPSEETKNAIIKLQEALMWLEKRTKDRTEREVLGTNKL